jgi:RNA polymerase sigma-70 factor (ECF subfamily)|uniref:Sigma-70 family RNA polymerase sigma factor n=1 Tax=candidate division WOR-3 bacterium TaxID=2052148 RepID=A0A7V3RIL4_UNCW3
MLEKKDSVIEKVNELKTRLSKYQELSDEELVHLVKMGEVEPFDELVRRHEVKVHNLCYKMLKNYDDAKDMAQETFLKAYKNINNFDGRSKFTTWLYRIAVNNCINFIKKQRPTEEVKDEILEIPKDDPVERYKKKRLKEALYNAISKLPEVQKSVFTLRALEELPYQEISTILKKPVNTVKVNYHLAVKNLKNYLKDKI